jgi:hypothetical protein
MEIRLDYRLSGLSLELDRSADMAAVAEGELLYDHFCGDLIIEIGEFDFSARWGWVTMLYTAEVLGLAADMLAADVESSSFLDFTENGAKLFFDRYGDDVLVHANYDSGMVVVPYRDLDDALRRFAARLLAELSAEFPGVALNPFVKALSAAAARRLDSWKPDAKKD